MLLTPYKVLKCSCPLGLMATTWQPWSCLHPEMPPGSAAWARVQHTQTQQPPPPSQLPLQNLLSFSSKKEKARLLYPQP